jgi:hypothetical protein
MSLAGWFIPWKYFTKAKDEGTSSIMRFLKLSKRCTCVSVLLSCDSASLGD